jgi:hypothetical protein
MLKAQRQIYVYLWLIKQRSKNTYEGRITPRIINIRFTPRPP